MKNIGYGFVKQVATDFDTAIAKVKVELQKEGFGVLSEIDMQQKLKEKIGVDFNRYIIMAACNPPIAYEALSTEINVGLFLPCNVVVYEQDGLVTLSIIRPSAAMDGVDNEEMKQIAQKTEIKLERAFNAV